MNKSKRRAQRDTTDIARDELATLLRPQVTLPRPLSLPSFESAESLREISDLRLFTPLEPTAMLDTAEPAVITRLPLEIGPETQRSVKSRSWMPPDRYAFADEQHALVCHRRKTRREVLHALKRTRRGSGGKKHRLPFSDVRC